MLKVLYGVDQVSAREKAQKYADDFGGVFTILEAGYLPEQGDLDDIFGAKQCFLLRNVAELLDEKQLQTWRKSQSLYLLLEAEKPKTIQAGETEEFDLPARSLANWIQKRAVIHGAQMDTLACERLIEYLSINESKKIETDQLWMLDTEVQKLACFVNFQKITVKDVEVMSSQGEGAIFSLVDAVLGGNAGTALKISEQIYNVEKDESKAILPLLAVLGDNLRLMRLLLIAKQKGASGQQAIRALEVSDWKLKRLTKSAERVGLLLVNAVLTKILLLDEEVKTSGLPPKPVLDLILLSLCKVVK